MLLAERFLSKLLGEHGNTLFRLMVAGGTQACRFLKLKHRLHSSFEKGLTERTIQYIKIGLGHLTIIFLAKERNAN